MAWKVTTADGTIKSGVAPAADVDAVSLHSALISGVAQVATGTESILNNWQTELYDTTGMHDSTNPGRITIRRAGVYAFVAKMLWNGVATTGSTYLAIYKNGVVQTYSDIQPWVNDVSINTIVTLDYQDTAVAGDYYEIAIYQNTGATRAWNTLTTRSRFSAVRVGSDPSYSAKTLPGVRAFRNAALSHTSSGTAQVVSLDTESFDTGTSVEQWTIGDPTKIYCRESGRYLVSGSIALANTGVGTVGGSIRQNGTTTLCYVQQPPNNNVGNNEAMNFQTTVNLASGDYIELLGYQTTGGNLAYGTGSANCYLEMTKIGETGQGASQLSHLADAEITSPTDKQVLTYNSSTSTFTNQNVPGADVWTTIYQTSCIPLAGTAVGTHFPFDNDEALIASATGGAQGVPLWKYTSAKYPVIGALTPQFRVSMTGITTAAQTATFNLGLHSISAIGGTTALNITSGGAVTGSATGATALTTGAAGFEAIGPSFTAASAGLTSGNHYLLGIVIGTAAIAASSVVSLTVKLEMRYA